jgi:activator of HSP90 ATPase
VERLVRRIIQQTVVLPAPAEQLYEAYLDPAAHAAITGRPVTIRAEEGAEFSAFDGQLSGMILALARPHLIVQSWRSCMFHDNDPDSVLILSFTSEGLGANEGRVDLVHLDVPEHDYEDVTKGWHKYYWSPWLAYLQALS